MRKELKWKSRQTGKEKTGYYEDSNDFSKLPQAKIGSVCAFCYYNNKFVIVKNERNWEPVAGHVEPGETPEEGLIREVKEESNMKVLKYIPIGYLYTDGDDIYQTRYLCFTEPYGPFVKDPDGGVTEIKLVDFSEITKYVEFGDTAHATLARLKEEIDKIQ
jgi:8-oxo-dGTP pyrophosphatase MutT (NUDIX family)